MSLSGVRSQQVQLGSDVAIPMSECTVIVKGRLHDE